MSEPLLNAEQVAKLLGVTTDYIYGLSRRGAIPVITFGRVRRYRREAIEQWLIELERGSVGGPQRNGRAGASTPPGRGNTIGGRDAHGS